MFSSENQKFERNTAGNSPDPDHRSRFERRLVVLKRDLKIRYRPYAPELRLSMMHPPIEMSKTVPSPLTLPPEGQKQAHRNAQMFSPIEHLRRITGVPIGKAWKRKLQD
ncbi:MAG: hypothetical protein IPJ44_14815 [Nitrospira sp.]|nr:hypothetical protein [Nitrospira sp.]